MCLLQVSLGCHLSRGMQISFQQVLYFIYIVYQGFQMAGLMRACRWQDASQEVGYAAADDAAQGFSCYSNRRS